MENAGRSSEEVTFSVENHLSVERMNEKVVLSPGDLEGSFGDAGQLTYQVFMGEEEIPSQWNKHGPDQGLVFILPKIEANQTIEINLKGSSGQLDLGYPKLTQAELSHKFGGEFKNREYIGGHFQNVTSLRVPPEHTDHSWFIRYEGPGWESDLVGYRFYLDWRNGIDVFGKKVSTPVLQDVGQDGFDSYHEPADWGMDILKVGKTLGLGSIATWEDGKARRVDVTDSLYTEITTNGPVYSSILTKYYGWDLPSRKTDITSEISIHSGTRLSRVDLTSSEEIPNFATGLIKDAKAQVLTSDDILSFSYLATYGPQSLAGDNLGIAIIYPTDRLTQVTADDLSHVLVFNSNDNTLSYYLLAAWEQEKGGVQSKKEFEDYLNKEIEKLSSPLEIHK
ncbi:DUF4861 domain-containing protein [Algoriphagus sp. AGSA1]|uniref:DUF4861 domain-containing protein n=1 Tax=Algoriphagus sp. AGSA1 TaxID=2907213 RepID=UPI001F457B87|nr:DUF4861 domain-containing protein [Algoriphagus sp. AGSA1]